MTQTATVNRPENIQSRCQLSNIFECRKLYQGFKDVWMSGYWIGQGRTARKLPEWWSTSFKAPSSNLEHIFRHKSTSNSSFNAFLNITWLALDPSWLRLPVMLVWANWTAFSASSKCVTPSLGSPMNSRMNEGKLNVRSSFSFMRRSVMVENCLNPISEPMDPLEDGGPEWWGCPCPWVPWAAEGGPCLFFRLLTTTGSSSKTGVFWSKYNCRPANIKNIICHFNALNIICVLIYEALPLALKELIDKKGSFSNKRSSFSSTFTKVYLVNSLSYTDSLKIKSENIFMNAKVSRFAQLCFMFHPFGKGLNSKVLFACKISTLLKL